MAGGKPGIRCRYVFEFEVKQARSIRGFTTEALQDADTHPPYATGEWAALPRDPRRGTQGRHVTSPEVNSNKTVWFFNGIPVNIKHVGFSAHTVQRRTTPAVLMNPSFGLGGLKK